MTEDPTNKPVLETEVPTVKRRRSDSKEEPEERSKNESPGQPDEPNTVSDSAVAPADEQSVSDTPKPPPSEPTVQTPTTSDVKTEPSPVLEAEAVASTDTTVEATPPTPPTSKPESSFEELLGTKLRAPEIEQGMIVSGKLIAITGDWAFIDLASKTEGILDIRELTDASGEVSVAIGDTVEAFVVSTRGGEIRLSQTLGRQIRDNVMLVEAYENKIPVEGRVTDTNKGGYEVNLAGRKAFCPISQIDLKYTDDPAVHVGNVYTFRVIEIRDDGKKIVLSRSAHLRDERKQKREELLEELVEGAEFEGVVKSIHEYGAFVDLGGIEGLVHVSEISWTRVEHPSEVIKEGDDVRVKVLGLKSTSKGKRVSLSIRQTTPHPWVAVGTKFVEGETYPGTVTRLEAYGAFVELGPGVEGLVHVSELSWERRINHPNEILSVGQPVEVYLMNIDEDRQRLALSVKALSKNPWSDANERYKSGATVTGKVEKVQPFGIFVEVEPGITALIPASETGTGHGTDLRRLFLTDQPVTATVLAVDGDKRRMSLSLKSAEASQDEREVRKFLDKQDKATQSAGSFGTLGDLFKDKLKK